MSGSIDYDRQLRDVFAIQEEIADRLSQGRSGRPLGLATGERIVFQSQYQPNRTSKFFAQAAVRARHKEASRPRAKFWSRW